MRAFYISSHGFGHLMRSLIHIEKYLKETNHDVYLVCGQKQIDFAKICLKKYKDRLMFKVMITDIGLINKGNCLEIDKKQLEKQLFKFIESWDEIVSSEIEILKKYDIEKIVTDISPIGMLLGKRLGIKVEAISNFTWYNQYNFLGLNRSILAKFLDAEKLIDEFYLYPLGLDLSHLHCPKKEIDYVSRKFNFNKIKKLKKEHKEIVFISCGKSANLSEIEIKNFDGTIYYTEGIKIFGEGNHVKLPLDIGDTHNYIGASDFVIIKAGWSTVAEAILSNVPMVLLERDGVLEDSHTIKELKNQNKAISFRVEDLKVLDIEKIKEKLKSLATD